MKLKEKRKCLGKEFQGRFFEELPWRIVQQITLDEYYDCFGALSSNSPRRVVQYILPKLGSKFSRTKSFCFENWIFYSHLA